MRKRRGLSDFAERWQSYPLVDGSVVQYPGQPPRSRAPLQACAGPDWSIPLQPAQSENKIRSVIGLIANQTWQTSCGRTAPAIRFLADRIVAT